MNDKPCIESCEECWKHYLSSQKPPEFDPFISGQRLFFLRPPAFLLKLMSPEMNYKSEFCIHRRIPE